MVSSDCSVYFDKKSCKEGPSLRIFFWGGFTWVLWFLSCTSKSAVLLWVSTGKHFLQQVVWWEYHLSRRVLGILLINNVNFEHSISLIKTVYCCYSLSISRAVIHLQSTSWKQSINTKVRLRFTFSPSATLTDSPFLTSVHIRVTYIRAREKSFESFVLSHKSFK